MALTWYLIQLDDTVKEKEQQFDEQTKLQIQSILEETDKKQQQSYQVHGNRRKKVHQVCVR